jgi:S-layer protein (TIGR01567 family)
MDHVRVMGVCLLLVIIATALPIDGLALASHGTAGPGINLEKGGMTVATPPVTNEITYTPVGPKPLELGAAQKNNTSADETELANASEGNVTTELNAAAEPNATSLEGVITPDMIPGENATSSNITPQEDAADNVTNNTQINETSVTQATIAPSENVTSENITSENITYAANIANITETTNATNATFALNATTLENATSTNESAVPEAVSESTGKEIAAPSEEAIEVGQARIWRQGINPLDYTWTPQSFSGFFYDLKDEVGAETLTVHLSGSDSRPDRAIAENNLVYKSNVQPIRYKYEDWGSYQVMGFMADKYFAGYGKTEVVDSNISLINDGQLRKVLIDSDDEHTITSGSVLPLEEGYELRIKEVDVNGNKAYMSLAKNGEEIDSKVISPNDVKSSTYQYKVKISGEDVPIIMAHISNVFASAESSLVTVDGVFQISEDYSSVESGDKYGKMKVSSVDDSGITMKNEDTLTLRKGGTVNIFGDVAFQVADDDVLRFAPIVQRTGTYTVRGTIIRPSDFDGKEFTWNPYNFEGFYYDIDDDIGTENLTAKFTGNSIDENDLVYETRPMSVKFKFEDWGRYDVIGFMADKYFAGYNDDTKFTDSVSAINEGQLRKVLIDSDDEQTIATGSVLALQEGYELRIKQVDINGNKVYLALAKDGKEVDSKVITPSSASDRASNYMYKVTVGSETDVPIITAHIQSVFRGTETDLATVDGLFQVSDNPQSVEEGEVYDKMKVRSLSDSIRMSNDAAISLARNKITTIMGNLQFQIADNPNRDLAPIAQKTVSGSLMTLGVPEAVVGNSVQINVKAGTEALSGVQISVAGQNIGNTDEMGNVSYTPDTIGTFDVVARKAGYGDATGSLVVSSSEEAVLAASNKTLSRTLTINVPSEVLKGDSFIITVVGGQNQTPMENVNISFDNTSIGSTNADGTLTYSSNETGEHKITAEAEGYDNAVREIAVMSPIVVNSINVPTMANTGDTVKVTANVQNTGTTEDTQALQLRVNDNVTDSKNVTLGPGENTTVTFSYKPKDPGTYRISASDKSGTLTVQKSQSNFALIALIIVILIAIGAGAYLYRTGELEALKKRMQGRQ